jgi:putative DNA primase/helicase
MADIVPGTASPDYILAAARAYVASGLSVVPVRADGSKAPAVAWKAYEKRRAIDFELHKWFSADRPIGIAIIGGVVSGVLEIIDFDDPALVAPWINAIGAVRPGLVERLPRIATPKGGAHFYYRAPAVEHNQKLAVAEDKHVLIETRGEGGYVLAPPSHPSCHPLGKAYVHADGPLLTEIPTISAEERTTLLETARSFNRAPKKVIGPGEKGNPEKTGEEAPGDDFNARATWDEVLEPYGWRKAKIDGPIVYWRRPGKTDDGHSASVGFCGDNLHVFSSNATPFEPDATYSKWAAITFLKYGGDFKKSAKDLLDLGYGQKTARKKKAEDEETITDIDAASTFVAHFGKNFRYCQPWSKWLAWDERRWVVDNRNAAYARSTEVAANANDKRQKAERISATLHVARPTLAITPEEMDRDPWTLNCLNGTLNLKDGTFREHSRDDFLTKLCPTSYLPDAKAERWEKFLMEIMSGNVELISYLQRLVGYALTGVIREHVLPIAYGTGANGKSTFLGTLRHILGTDYAAETAPDLIMTRSHAAHPTERADLAGKRFVTTIEVEDGRHLAENFVKQLTGGDDLKVRRMREDFWTLKPTWKIFMATNNKPEIKGMDAGIWRRVRLIPFSVTISPAAIDTMLGEKLLGEASGILAWAVRGCLDWQKKGLHDPPAVTEATAEYKQDTDVMGRFFSDCCVILPQLRAQASGLYETFREWFEVEVGTEPMNGTVFGRRLTEMGFKVEKISGKKWRIGIGIGELSWKTAKMNEF